MSTRVTIEAIDSLKDLAYSVATEYAKRLPNTRYCDIRVEVDEVKGAAAENGNEKGSSEDYGFAFGVRVIAGRRATAARASIFDDLPGVGPVRKRVLAKHFGSPDALLAASRDELESVPGLPAKVGRDIFHFVNRTK